MPYQCCDYYPLESHKCNVIFFLSSALEAITLMAYKVKYFVSMDAINLIKSTAGMTESRLVTCEHHDSLAMKSMKLDR